MLIKLLVCFVAGIGAGLGTGFAGMSAAAVITPMLITFLDMDPYMAVGIALASDVLASAVSAYTYGKNRNLDVKNGLIMMFTVLGFTLVGSYLASLLPSATMGGFSTVMTLLLGIKFIVKPVMTTKEAMASVSAGKRAVQSVLSGTLIGLICGFVGAGGGMMMLLILTSVLGYELKTAPVADAEDLHVKVQRRAHHRADGRVHAGRVAAGGQNRDLLLVCHILFLSFSSRFSIFSS